MRAEIMAIGDELTTGQRLDTNTQWLAERLCDCGIEPAFHTTIGDDLDDHVAALRTATDRADVVISTGGLGPTADDLTRQAMADAAGVALQRDAASLEHIRTLFAARGAVMAPRNELQADFPTGATPIANPHGTAPGVDMAFRRTDGGQCRMFALPGVPAEMFAMWTATVEPALLAMQSQPRVTRHHRIKCFGVGESSLEAMLPDMIRRGRDPIVGITVSDASITLRITASGVDAAACEAIIAPTVAEIRSLLGDLIFGEEEDELEHATLRALDQAGLTLAVGEWGTAGLVNRWLASVPSMGSYCGGVTVADRRQLLRLDRAAALGESANESAQAALVLAQSARELSGADLGLGISAFPDDPDRPDAYVAFALATPHGEHRYRGRTASHPAIRQARAGKQALNFVRRFLLKGDENQAD
ncbi:MAG: CinA family nicotinamide mononucleotide deamidase-related protein [Planctomycetales bacterium]|nr:CinA family nicotinamide mononucleotide deamidase-related protein [Planctomycetales bacterium]